MKQTVFIGPTWEWVVSFALRLADENAKAKALVPFVLEVARLNEADGNASELFLQAMRGNLRSRKAVLAIARRVDRLSSKRKVKK